MTARQCTYIFFYGSYFLFAFGRYLLGYNWAIVGDILIPIAICIAFPFITEGLAKRFPLIREMLDEILITLPEPPPPPPPTPTLPAYTERLFNMNGHRCRERGIETVDGDVRDRLKSLISHFYAQALQFPEPPVALTALEPLLTETLFVFSLYAPPREGTLLTTAPLYEVIDTPNAVAHLVSTFFKEEGKLFSDLQHALNTNRYNLSRPLLSTRQFEDGVRVNADQFKGTHRELVDGYLKDTPFHAVFFAPVPIRLAPKSRFEHMHVIASQGHGKTQTLQMMIDRDLETDASLIVIDPHGDMFNRISRLQTTKQIIVIDPRDAPALNPFDVTGLDLSDTQALTATISLYEYFFGSLLGSELTAKQGVLFRYLSHLMMRIPKANLTTLIEVMNDATPFLPDINQLPPNARTFLTNEFLKGRTFEETKAQVKYRLYDLIENPAFDQMFNAAENKLDLKGAMDSGAVVLIHADASYLEQKRASIFGRFFIAKALQAALQRASQPESQRRPTYLYIDEAWMFFDTKIDEILDQARKFKLGLILAHQRLAQATPELQSSLATTAIKLVGNVSEHDARTLAPNMHTDADNLRGLSNDKTSAEWALYDRNAGRRTVKVSIPFFHMENQPARFTDDYTAFRKANKEALRATPVVAPTPLRKGQEF